MVKNKKAVSLLEILVAALILSFVVGGLVSAFLSVRRYIRHAKERATAAGLARSFSKTLYKDAGKSQDLPLTAGVWANIDNVNYETDSDGDGDSSRYQVTGVDLDSDGVDDYRRVVITIEYPD